MKWLLRFLMWATVLSLPSLWVSHLWQHGLARVAMAVLAAVGQGVEIQDVELMAPFDLAIFAAMCLSSASAPWAQRRRALAIGLPALLGIEVLTVVAAIGVTLPWRENSPQLEASMRLTGNVIETVPWVSAAVVWLLLLGPWELRMPVPARATSRPALDSPAKSRRS
jgi:hypothetical protein